MYCVSVWGSTYQSSSKRIFLLQKKLIRLIISKTSFDAHTGPLFKDLQILKFHDIYQYHTGKLMFLFTNNSLSNCFKSMFMSTSQVYSYNTRTSKLFYMFPCKTNLRQFSIRFQGPKFFNSLSNNIKDCENISLFRKSWRNFPCLCKFWQLCYLYLSVTVSSFRFVLSSLFIKYMISRSC